MKNRYMDLKLQPEERAQTLLEQLSLDEKMAQLNCIFPFGESYSDMEAIKDKTKYGMGQVSTLEMRRMKSLEEVAAWQRKVQQIVMENSEHHIPAVFHMEGLCGAFIQDSTSFPAGIARGSSWDPELEEQIAEIVSRQEAACGITQVFAPILDITRDSRMGRQGECYGEDPVLVAALGSAYTKGIQKNEVAGRRTESVAKHFLAFHNSQGGIHGTHSDTPERPLQEIYGKPFQAAITESGLRGVMPCYCSVNGEPVTASKYLLQKLLREDMGFDGVCVSDYGAVSGVHNVHHIGESIAEAGLRCLKAGIDVETHSADGYGEGLKKMFADGKAGMEILDAAVRRVLTAKFRMGIFENPFALVGEELQETFTDENDYAISLKSALESIVLMKNDGVLPVNKQVKKIALIGPHANNAGKFFGGYTHLCMEESIHAVRNSIAGFRDTENVDGESVRMVPGTNIQSDETETFTEILRRQKPDCDNLLEKLRKEMPDTQIVYAYGYPVAGNDQSGFAAALELIKEADLVIMTLGGKHGTCSLATMGEGVDAVDINLPECQDEFIKKAAELGRPLVGIHFNGRPISSDIADQYLNAILEAWNPSEAGAEALTSVLLGTYNPGGKMPVSVAFNSGQIPVYYNHPYGSAWHQGESIGFVNYVDLPHTPRYHFGHGLSYTKFLYTDLQIKETEISADESVIIELNLQNVGKLKGDEVVQLYIRDIKASMSRPVKELAGFKRVTLEAGEMKHITFRVAADQLAFLDEDMRWKVEKGAIEVEVGSSSQDIRLTGSFKIKNDTWIEGKDRRFYAAVEVS